MDKLELDDPSRVVKVVETDGIRWEISGGPADVTLWLGNATQHDRDVIRQAAREAGEGECLLITFPSAMAFYLGYDKRAQRFTAAVPVRGGQ